MPESRKASSKAKPTRQKQPRTGQPVPVPPAALDLDDDLVLGPELASAADQAEADFAAAGQADADFAAAEPGTAGQGTAAASPIHLLVPVEAANTRLDHFLTTALAATHPGLSRARIQQLLAASRITCNGQPARPSLRLRGGEFLELPGQPERPAVLTRPEPIPLTVLHEDPWLAVILKPAGRMVHAGAGANDEARASGTIVNALLHRFPQLSALGGPLRPGIVHRLDKETSGLLVIAKTDEAHAALVERFAARQITKTYIALVEGHLEPDAGTIDLPIRRDSVRRTRMTTLPGDGARTAITHFRVTDRIHSAFGRFTLLRLRIETGRTHQIRVHLAAQRHPVVGDNLYGAAATLHAHPRTGSVRAPRQTLALDRHFLHAAELAFDHPFTGQPLHLVADLPADLTTLLETLQAPHPGA